MLDVMRDIYSAPTPYLNHTICHILSSVVYLFVAQTDVCDSATNIVSVNHAHALV